MASGPGKFSWEIGNYANKRQRLFPYPVGKQRHHALPKLPLLLKAAPSLARPDRLRSSLVDKGKLVRRNKVELVRRNKV